LAGGLGTYVRLESLGILPMSAFDEGFQGAFYYQDPDQNGAELNVNYYGNDWTATEDMKSSSSMLNVQTWGCRSREDDHGTQGERLGFETARACLCRRVRSRNAV
jgi:catechol-2,3-dioxygenase